MYNRDNLTGQNVLPSVPGDTIPRFCSPTSKVTDDNLFIRNNLGDARIVSEGGDRLFEGTENRLPGWR